MGKRSEFERNPMDYYATPREAVAPLLPYLPANSSYCEPCAGEGKLIDHLTLAGHHCVSAFDADSGTMFRHHDASWIQEQDLHGAQLIITNPPWDRKPLHQIIERCSLLRPTWLLFDADWAHTRQSSQYMKMCRVIVSIGRVKWIENSSTTGKDNCCWYLFDQNVSGETVFRGRT